jgi:hypothetical protein
MAHNIFGALSPSASRSNTGGTRASYTPIEDTGTGLELGTMSYVSFLLDVLMLVLVLMPGLSSSKPGTITTTTNAPMAANTVPAAGVTVAVEGDNMR